MPNKIKIMIIEDEDAISNFIATTLKANAYAPLLAKTAGQALSMIPSHCPDLILLDLGLPDMDGIEILKKIREWSAVPLIVVSARGDNLDAAVAQRGIHRGELLVRNIDILQGDLNLVLGYRSPV